MRVAVSRPSAIYTVGLNYEGRGAAPRPERPLIYGKAPSSVAAHGDTLTWDRELTPNVDAGVLPGRARDRHARRVRPGRRPARLHDQRRTDPGRPDERHAILDRRGH